MIWAMQKLFHSAWRGSQPPKAHPAVAPNTRVYAIGDIHGRADLLERMETMIAADLGNAPKRNVIVHLGDYIDRGLESAAVLDHLIEARSNGVERIFLCGNHEDAMLRFLDEAEIGPMWIGNGGDATLYSYGIRPRADLPYAQRLVALQEDLRAKIPSGHLDFLRGLTRLHVEGDYLFVHAGIRPGVAINRQSPDDLIWIREPFLSARGNLGKIVVHGHTINARIEAPDIRPNRIGIDTGAYATGTLTCLVLEGEKRRFLQT
jgi:serine/threonine protein phosphatase 1